MVRANTAHISGVNDCKSNPNANSCKASQSPKQKSVSQIAQDSKKQRKQKDDCQYGSPTKRAQPGEDGFGRHFMSKIRSHQRRKVARAPAKAAGQPCPGEQSWG